MAKAKKPAAKAAPRKPAAKAGPKAAPKKAKIALKRRTETRVFERVANPAGMLPAFIVNPERGSTMASKKKAKKPAAKKAAKRRANPEKRKANPSRVSNPKRSVRRRRRRNPEGGWVETAKRGGLVLLGAVCGAIVASFGYGPLVQVAGLKGAAAVCTAGGVALAGAHPIQKEAAIGAGAVLACVGTAGLLRGFGVGNSEAINRVSQFAPSNTAAANDGSNTLPEPQETKALPPADARTMLRSLMVRGRSMRGLEVVRAS